LKDDYKNCNNCDNPICKNCGNKHEKRNPNHKVRIVKKKNPAYIKDKKDDKIGDNELTPNFEHYPKINCAIYNKDIPSKKNTIVKYCYDCNDNICNNCNMNHDNKYPDHDKNNDKLSILNKMKNYHYYYVKVVLIIEMKNNQFNIVIHVKQISVIIVEIIMHKQI
jgi:hypothetical protein